MVIDNNKLSQYVFHRVISRYKMGSVGVFHNAILIFPSVTIFYQLDSFCNIIMYIILAYYVHDIVYLCTIITLYQLYLLNVSYTVLLLHFIRHYKPIRWNCCPNINNISYTCAFMSLSNINNWLYLSTCRDRVRRWLLIRWSCVRALPQDIYVVHCWLIKHQSDMDKSCNYILVIDNIYQYRSN